MVFPKYEVFRAMAIFAGVFGIFQSLIWIGFAITGIIAYYCDMNFSGQTETLGSLLTLTFFHQYFEGSCQQQDIPLIDMTAVRQLNLFPPSDLHAWVWVYLILHFLWAISSLTLLTNARKKYVRYINIFLYIWITFTIVISILDLALGIQFAVDYDTIIHALFLRPYPSFDAADQTLSAAVTVSGIMVVMSFRGFVFWVVNVTLAVYLFTQTFKIYDFNQFRRKTGTTNGGFTGDNEGPRRAPIDAYDMGHTHRLNYADSHRSYDDRPTYNPPPSNYRRPLDRIQEQPRETIIERPVQLLLHQQQQQPDYPAQPRSYTPQPQPQPQPQPSTSVQRTFEPLAARQPTVEPFEQPEEIRPDPPKPIPPPPPPKNFNNFNTVVRRDAAAAKVAQELNYRNSMNFGPGNGLRTFGAPQPPVAPAAATTSANNDGDLPTPNYSPPMPRVNPFENRPPLRSVLRNSRYQ